MNKTVIFIVFWLLSWNILAQESQKLVINDFIVTQAVEVYKPVFADLESIKGEVFEDQELMKYTYLQHHDFRPEAGDELEWQDLNFLKWKKLSANKSGRVGVKAEKGDFQIAYLAFYLQNDAWAELELELKSGQMLEVFVDGKKQKGKYSWQKEGEEKSLKLDLKLDVNNHIVLIKTLLSSKESDHWDLSCEIETKNKENKVALLASLNPSFFMDINHLLNGVDIRSAQISADGDYYFISYKMTNKKGESQNITDVRRMVDKQTIQLFYGNDVSGLEWMPYDNKLSYSTKVGGKTWIWEYDLESGHRFPVASDLEDISGYTWSPNGAYLILSSREKAKKNKSGLKKLEGMADHWPWYRSRNNLMKLDILSGIKTPLTHAFQSNNLMDISPNGRYILIAQHIYDNSQRPYSKQILLQYDNRTRKMDTIWNRFGSGRVQYSPDGSQLLVLAGPAFFGELGTQLKKAIIPNDYDTQAYLYSFNDGSVKAISKSFNPSISSAYWSKINTDDVYFRVSDRTYVYVYRYSMSSESFTLLNLDMDVVNSANFAINKPLMISYGSSISTPKKAFIIDLETKENVLLDYPEEHFFQDIDFGKNEDWNFTNKEGVTIEGRIYYPPNFDANKKYPMIVYYYGGTSPTERNFRGRYPKNLFAANGYIVYVLQPSGATGYGQDFSAEHVNNWGKTVADEIIDGSRLLCQTHSFIDSTQVGCMGASYGGFMTMYLTTQTDFFSAAISHAGISSISSYWGEGYWGYLYSQVASANSFPWNNKDLYVNQSPLFHADKVNTPILLLHGNSDTNVPPGESRQFYTALKLLDKDVELIEIDQQNHHIVDYQKRILWQQTILAWFDKNLKSQSDWWFHLYPKNKI
ncbi:MAG: prolyl oligopeptidase family serine peptidase [Bacteroidales bacterium]|nr:prolyl oligopeptidase family serine peptidase [Bacteroidales bacterium]